jgi:RNA polymerase sigma-70 factor (ECF subfamily)
MDAEISSTTQSQSEPSAMTGDRTAGLVTEHYDSLYRYAYRLSGSHGDAEDLVQETFLIAMKKLNQVRDVASVRTWLYTVLRNGYLKGIRRNAPVLIGALAEELGDIPERIEDADIDREELQQALNELPDEFKLVLLQFYFEDCSYLEIASNLDVPVGTVMSRLSRAKTHLRQRLFGSKDRERAKQESGKSKTPQALRS